MNIYYNFYCKIYELYNATGKKNKDTLRVSAIAMISVLPCLFIITIFGFISIYERHTIINKWVGGLMFFIFLGFNLILISTKKSDILQSNYSLLSIKSKRLLTLFFFLCLCLLLLLFIIMLGYTAYYKHKYGNYDYS